jgi:hypothetical protein
VGADGRESGRDVGRGAGREVGREVGREDGKEVGREVGSEEGASRATKGVSSCIIVSASAKLSKGLYPAIFLRLRSLSPLPLFLESKLIEDDPIDP